jgi:hypothetical protein
MTVASQIQDFDSQL